MATNGKFDLIVRNATVATASDLFWSDMPVSGMWLAAGRKDRPVHVRERVRLDLFVRIADTLLG